VPTEAREASEQRLRAEDKRSVRDALIDRLQSGSIKATSRVPLAATVPRRDPPTLCKLPCRNETPLHDAVRLGDVEAIRHCVSEDAAVIHARNKHGRTALFVAVSGKQSRELVENLLELGSEPTASDRKRITALHKAAARGYVDLAEALLKAGADPNWLNKDGETPLYAAIAVEKPSKAMVELLLRSGADVNAGRKSHRPINAALQTRKSDKSDVACDLLKREIAELLLRAGADPNALGHGRRTELHSCASEGKLELFELLVRFGADFTLADKKGEIPLGLLLKAKKEDDDDAAELA
jgi:ankyrin repeat protein